MFNKKLEKLIENVLINGKNSEINGYLIFNEKAKFLCGSLFEGATYSLSLKKHDSEITINEIKNIKKILNLTEGLEAQTFGIMGQLNGLYTLKSIGLYNQVIDKKTERKLMKKLHWNTFLDEKTLKLKFDLPFNYYSVAFRCAKLRELVGWNSEIKSDIFLDIYLKHSSKNSFMDETFGEGRFDRYTLITPAEIAEMFVVAGEEVPPKIKNMLTECVNIVLDMSNENGLGIAYGRSLGVFGDTAIIEVLSIAYKIGLITPKKIEKAVLYSKKVLKRIEEFWFDKELDSINIWLKGRKTDSYRNVNRIFGTNVTTFIRCMKAMEYLEISENFEKLDNQTFRVKEKFGLKIHEFDSGKKSLIIITDGDHKFQLSIINGGERFYNKTPYYNLPFECEFIEGIPEVTTSLYTPMLSLSNGKKAMPISFINDVKYNFDREEKIIKVVITYSSLCEIDKYNPYPISTNQVKVTYNFQPGKIERLDEIELKENMTINNVELTIPCFDKATHLLGKDITILNGKMKKISINGFNSSDIKENSIDLATPTGSYKNKFVFSKEVNNQKIKVGWSVEY